MGNKMAKGKNEKNVKGKVEEQDIFDDTKISMDDFEVLKVIGRGAFGKVMLVKKKGKDITYAMKTIKKADLLKHAQVAHTVTERHCLHKINNPFLVHLQYAFQTPEKLYMILDFMAGGELFYWMKQQGTFRESRVQLYTAEIILGLEALHVKNIVYRDLKPENLLLDADGHIKITDFGLAKEGITGWSHIGGTKTICGTVEYMAPEVLTNTGYGKAVDWWAVGILIYELLYGLPAFFDQDQQKMIKKIQKSKLEFPKSKSSEQVKHIITLFLERSVPERLGTGPDGIKNIKAHEWFKGIEFDKVMTYTYPAEFIPPKSKHESDVRNFDDEFTMEAPSDSYCGNQMTGTMQQKANFEGFTFRGSIDGKFEPEEEV